MNFFYENKKIKQGYTAIIGCDEVGRGCLAGPVVAAAVMLPRVESYQVHKVIKSAGVRDSKLLTPQKREELSVLIKQRAFWSVGVVSQNIIDEINIHNASLLAMRKAVQNMLVDHSSEWSTPKILVAVDGKFVIPGFGEESISQQAIIDGDNKVLSIAAASIIAKVYRDELMKKLHYKYPLYNFHIHKGYATLHHRRMIVEHGLTKIHRKSFCEHLVSHVL